MTPEDMISQLAERHGWKDISEVVKLRLSGLKVLLEQAYEEGKQRALAEIKLGQQLGQSRADELNRFFREKTQNN